MPALRISPGTGCLCGDAAVGNDLVLESETARMLSRLLSELESRGRIILVSGYRSHEEQVRIWEDTWEREGEEFTRTYVAEPGHSEHESGLAVDLAENREPIDFIRPEFPRAGICQEFRRRAARYGFIERYPAGKEAVTGIGVEPWHFRYVGVPHSLAMKREGMVLEEYVSFLRENTSPQSPYLCFGPEAGVCTEIFYLPVERGKNRVLSCPADETLWFSGTNEGGVVGCRRRSLYG
ncbi:MAG: M15 family metallopeptidase [Lachnospiraceae bacterium]|nr:M15 family metallopeptidase [Lachnospiraceae bacterium]